MSRKLYAMDKNSVFGIWCIPSNKPLVVTIMYIIYWDPKVTADY